MNLHNVMLDLETLGSNPRAPIASIGACKFEPFSGEVTDHFYVRVDVTGYDALAGKFVADYATIKWWLGQSREAIAGTFFDGEALTLSEALRAFTAYLASPASMIAYMPPVLKPKFDVWGNGADFDNVILGYAYHALGLERPWSYGRNRCYRTMKNVVPLAEPARLGVHHNALDDALHQARHLCEIVAALR